MSSFGARSASFSSVVDRGLLLVARQLCSLSRWKARFYRLRVFLRRHIGEDEQWRGPMAVALPAMIFLQLTAASVCVEHAPEYCGDGRYCERYWVCQMGYLFLGLHCVELLLKARA